MRAWERVDAFNEVHPSGTPVHYWRGTRQDAPRTGFTDGEAWVTCADQAVVRVQGNSGWLSLSHVDPLYIPVPFRSVGGTVRSRTCAHCGRSCGDIAGGWGEVQGVPVCHPNEEGRPDCYHLATVGGHQVRDCPVCTDRSAFDAVDRAVGL